MNNMHCYVCGCSLEVPEQNACDGCLSTWEELVEEEGWKTLEEEEEKARPLQQD
jgi:hypothetical protein